MPTTKLPVVTVAAICERVLQERDNVISVIRLVDKFFISSIVPTDGSFAMPITILLALKTGSADPGEHWVSIRVRRPSGAITALEAHRWPVQFGEEANSGGNLILNLPLKTTDFGMHWIDVLCDDQPLTTIPFTLLQQVAASAAEPSDQKPDTDVSG